MRVALIEIPPLGKDHSGHMNGLVRDYSPALHEIAVRPGPHCLPRCAWRGCAEYYVKCANPNASAPGSSAPQARVCVGLCTPHLRMRMQSRSRHWSLIRRWDGNPALKEWQRALPHNTGSSPDRLQKIRCRGHSC